MSFSLLSDDECIRILSHLEEPELDLVAEVSKTCARVARCDAVWASRAKDLCARYTFDRRDFEGNFLYLLEQDPLLPAYDGPPLRSHPPPQRRTIFDDGLPPDPPTSPLAKQS